MLSRSIAVAIVDAVAADKTCAERITSAFSTFGTSSGPMRNAYYWLHHPWRPAAEGSEESNYVCYGIAEATINAINAARFDKGSTLNQVWSAGQADRNVGEWGEHYATSITLKLGKSPDNSACYVFDWWATLDLQNPLIYLSMEAFRNKSPRALFSTFPGESSMAVSQ